MFSAALAAFCLLLAIPIQTVQDKDAAILKGQQAYIVELRKYFAESPNLGVQEAAKRWLQLVDDAKKVPWHTGGMGDSPRMQQVQIATGEALDALPRPDVWPAIEAILSHRPPTTENDLLLVIFARLRGDDREVIRLCDRIAPKLRDTYYFDVNVRYGAVQRTRTFQSQLRAAEGKSTDESSNRHTLFPALVGQVPDSEAHTIVLSALSSPDRLWRFQDEPTHKLVLRLLANRLDQVKQPPWDLVRGVGDEEFLLRLVDRLGPPHSMERVTAQSEAEDIYLGYLLRTGKVDKAKAAWKEGAQFPYPYGPFSTVDWRDIRKTFGAVSQMLEDSSDFRLWDTYAAGAMASGHSLNAVHRVEAKLNSPSCTPREKREALQRLADLHAALGDLSAYSRDVGAFEALPRQPDESVYLEDHRLKAGILLHDKIAVQAGLDYEQRAENRSPDIVDLYASQGTPVQIERYVWRRIAQERRGPGTIFTSNEYGKDLCRAAYLENDPSKLVETLETYPFWTSNDLRDLLDERQYPGERVTCEPLFYYAAWAFAKTGRKDISVRILKHALALLPDYVQAFELLNETAGQAAKPFYDQLLAADSFSAPALVGKADLLRREGRLAQAEKLARQAIYLDPTDGLAPIGRRFDGARVLAGILRAESKRTEAKACEAKVQAGRLTDRGQALGKIGFFPQACQVLREAIRKDPNDYLSEELLAEDLDAQGKEDGTNHHRRAFDLLRNSFGPMTWYEGSSIPYGGGLQEFRDRVEISPAKTAGAYCFKADLERIDHRPVEAKSDYDHALALDSRYPAALHGLIDLGREGFLAPSRWETAALALLDLEPYFYRNASWDLASVRDIRPVYRRLLSARKHLQASSSERLFPLHSTWYEAASHLDPYAFWGGRQMDLDTPIGIVAIPSDIGMAIEAYGELAEQNHE